MHVSSSSSSRSRSSTNTLIPHTPSSITHPTHLIPDLVVPALVDGLACVDHAPPDLHQAHRHTRDRHHHRPHHTCVPGTQELGRVREEGFGVG